MAVPTVPPSKHRNITSWNFSFIFPQESNFWLHTNQYQVISCFDPNCFNEILAAPEKVNINFVSAAVNEIDCVALKQELTG